MKVGIIGAGFVGAACAKAMLLRGSCHEIVLFDTKVTTLKDKETGEEREVRLDAGVANDLSHGELLCPPTRVRHGGYEDMVDASVIIITAGINEKTGNAIDREDNRGRLLLLPKNAEIYHDIIPRIARIAPKAPILVVTDPPDALADIARTLTDTNPVLSSGTFLDSLRFRFQLAQRLRCHASSVEALVIGEHGTSQVYVWSSARVGGVPVLEHVARHGWDTASFKTEVQHAVKYANIEIIEGTGASQHAIGIVTARLVEAMLRDEGLVEPIGVYQPKYDVTLSLPAVIGRGGVSARWEPLLSDEESGALAASAAFIKAALAGLL
jgi:L-lactate dehydrogenase